MAALAGASRGAAARAGGRWIEPRHIHANEIVRTAFQDSNGLVADALAKLQHLLRDHRPVAGLSRFEDMEGASA